MSNNSKNYIFVETTRTQMNTEYEEALAAEQVAIDNEAKAMASYLEGGNGCPDAAYEAAVEKRLAAKQARIDAWHNVNTANLEW